MKSLKKALIGITTAMVLAGTAVCTVAFAEEAPQAEESATKTFTTEDGVLSIQIPRDDDNWSAIHDPNSWFAITDGTDMITVDHIAAGDPLPAVELADEHYEEIYQVFYSTKDEVFVVTGRIANKDEAQTVKDAVNSFQVLKYGEVTKKDEQRQPVYAVRDVNETRYCTEKDGVNVRSGYTTDDPRIGSFQYGDQVTVTGIVTRDGTDIGWLRVNYNGQTGYTVAQFYSLTPPDAQNENEEALIADGQIFTGNKMYNMINPATGEYVVLSELNQGGWANEETGEIFHWETPQDGSPKMMFGDKDTVLWIDTVYYEVHSDDVEEEELINDGQIFTGNYMTLYDEYGNAVTLSELSQGGWADEDTGEIFNRGPAGADYWYGDQGTTLSAEFDDGGYAGSNYNEDEHGGYAGSNYYEEDYE